MECQREGPSQEERPKGWVKKGWVKKEHVYVCDMRIRCRHHLVPRPASDAMFHGVSIAVSESRSMQRLKVSELPRCQHFADLIWCLKFQMHVLRDTFSKGGQFLACAHREQVGLVARGFKGPSALLLPQTARVSGSKIGIRKRKSENRDAWEIESSRPARLALN